MTFVEFLTTTIGLIVISIILAFSFAVIVVLRVLISAGVFVVSGAVAATQWTYRRIRLKRK